MTRIDYAIKVPIKVIAACIITLSSIRQNHAIAIEEITVSSENVSLRRLSATEIESAYSGEDPGINASNEMTVSDGERFAIGTKLRDVFSAFELRLNVSDLNAPKTSRADAFARFSSDRTVTIEFETWGHIRPSLVRKLSATLKVNFRRWRVLVAGRVKAAAFLIYPECVRFDGAIFSESLSQNLAAVQRLEKNAYDRHEGAEQLQLRVAKSLFNKMQLVRNIQHACIVAHFDNWRGEADSSVVWVFHRGDSYADFKLSPSNFSMSKKYEVKHDGSWCDLYDLSTKDRAGYLIEVVYLRSTPCIQQIELAGRCPE